MLRWTHAHAVGPSPRRIHSRRGRLAASLCDRSMVFVKRVEQARAWVDAGLALRRTIAVTSPRCEFRDGVSSINRVHDPQRNRPGSGRLELE